MRKGFFFVFDIAKFMTIPPPSLNNGIINKTTL